MVIRKVMDRFMTIVPFSIVIGALIGVAVQQNGLTEDQSLGLCVAASILILYATKDME
jgi:hypothetical protein